MALSQSQTRPSKVCKTSLSIGPECMLQRRGSWKGPTCFEEDAQQQKKLQQKGFLIHSSLISVCWFSLGVNPFLVSRSLSNGNHPYMAVSYWSAISDSRRGHWVCNNQWEKAFFSCHMLSTLSIGLLTTNCSVPSNNVARCGHMTSRGLLSQLESRNQELLLPKQRKQVAEELRSFHLHLGFPLVILVSEASYLIFRCLNCK